MFLVFYLAGAIVLVNTGHNGRPVHEYGVQAIITPSPSPVPETLAAQHSAGSGQDAGRGT